MFEYVKNVGLIKLEFKYSDYIQNCLLVIFFQEK